MRRPRVRLWFLLCIVALVGVVIYLVTSPRWRSRWFLEHGELDRAWTEALPGVLGGSAVERQLAGVLAEVIDTKSTPERREGALTTLAALGPNATPALPQVRDILRSDGSFETEILLALAVAGGSDDTSRTMCQLVAGHLADPHEPAYGPVATWSLLGRHHRHTSGPLPPLAEQARLAFTDGTFGRNAELPIAFAAAHAFAAIGASHWDLAMSALRECPEDLAYPAALALGLTRDLPPAALHALCGLLETEPVTSRRLAAAAFALALHAETAGACEPIIRSRLRELCLSEPAVNFYPVATTLWLLALIHPRSPETLAEIMELLQPEGSCAWRPDLLLCAAQHVAADDTTAAALLGLMRPERQLDYEIAMAALLIAAGNPDAEREIARQFERNAPRSHMAWPLTQLAVQSNPQLFVQVVGRFLDGDTTNVRSDLYDQQMAILGLLGERADELGKRLRDARHSSTGVWHLEARHRALARFGDVGVRAILSDLRTDEPEATWWTGRLVPSLRILGDQGVGARAAVPALTSMCESDGDALERKEAGIALVRIAGGNLRMRAGIEACLASLPQTDQLDLALAGLDFEPPDPARIRRVLELLEAGAASDHPRPVIARRLQRARQALLAARLPGGSMAGTPQEETR